MSEKSIVLIPGDGIGTEIIAAAKAVCDVAFEKASVKVNWIDKKARGSKAWKPENRDRYVSAALRAYGAMATSADKGAVRDVSQIER